MIVGISRTGGQRLIDKSSGSALGAAAPDSCQIVIHAYSRANVTVTNCSVQMEKKEQKRKRKGKGKGKKGDRSCQAFVSFESGGCAATPRFSVALENMDQSIIIPRITYPEPRGLQLLVDIK